MYPEWSLCNQQVLAAQALLHFDYCAFPREPTDEVLV